MVRINRLGYNARRTNLLLRKKFVVKKYWILLLASVLCSCFIPMSFAGNVEDEIVKRIKRIGSVCIEGHDCAGESSEQAVASTGGGAESNYNTTCATCHGIGLAGAPKFGEKDAWESRIAKGMEVLYQSSINGLPPGMPAKGMCFTCSDDELKAIVDYMVEAVQ